MTERQKVWTTANSGNTQGWIQTLPLSHLDNVLTNFEFRAIYRRRARLPVFTGAMKCANCKNLTADQYGDHTLRCENRIQRHNFVSARLKKILKTCGYKVTVEEGFTVHDKKRPGDLLVWNWEPGVNLYRRLSDRPHFPRMEKTPSGARIWKGSWAKRKRKKRLLQRSL